MSYITLFFASLLAATLLPIGSEALLIYDFSVGYNPHLLILFATVGNTIGSIINYYIGFKGVDYLTKKDYISTNQLTTATHIFKKYGSFSLLLSWMPFIGDPITFVAGVLKYNIRKFIAIVFIAKLFRYLVVWQFFVKI